MNEMKYSSKISKGFFGFDICTFLKNLWNFDQIENVKTTTCNDIVVLMKKNIKIFSSGLVSLVSTDVFWGQDTNPLIEYKNEGYDMFLEMMTNMRRNVIYSMFMFKPAPPAGQAAVQTATS